jgi:hypothetical protein
MRNPTIAVIAAALFGLTLMLSCDDNWVYEGMSNNGRADEYISRFYDNEHYATSTVYDMSNSDINGKYIYKINGEYGGEVLWYTYNYGDTTDTNVTVSTIPSSSDDNNFNRTFRNRGGSVTFNVSGSDSGNVGAALGFAWGKDGKDTIRDISDWNGVYITYAITGTSGVAEVYAMINSDSVNSPCISNVTTCDEYRTLIYNYTYSREQRRRAFRFSEFEPEGGTQVPLATVLQKSHGMNFQMSTNGTATLQITKVELFKY